jgi:hypothetical protein
LLRATKFDAIFSSFSPPASHVVASILARRHGIPWVADFRDLWTQNHIGARRGPLHWLERGFEKRILRGCRSMTTVSEPLKEELERLHGKPVAVLPNGFDPEDYPEIPAPSEGPLRIVYTGMLYPGKRDPSPLFEAVRRTIDDGRLPRDGLRIEFYGSDPELVFGLAEAHGVRDMVEALPRIAHAESVRRQLAADVLLLLEWNDPRAKGVYTGKVFEYLGARRPILALGPSGGVLEALLRDTRAGVLAATTGDICEALAGWFSERRRAGRLPYAADAGTVLSFSRRGQADALARALDAAVRGKAS